MPIYDYRCDGCGEIWEENHSMANSSKPCDAACPHCTTKGKVKKHIGGFPAMSVDTTMSADKKTDGMFSERMQQIQDKLPDQYKDNLNHGLSGKKWR